MITEDKVTEIFCMTNDFCYFFVLTMENMGQRIFPVGEENIMSRV